MRNTIKNVMIVVAVLITSCQVSEKWKSGPRTAQAIIATTAKAKAVGEPTASDNHWAQMRNFPRKGLHVARPEVVSGVAEAFIAFQARSSAFLRSGNAFEEALPRSLT